MTDKTRNDHTREIRLSSTTKAKGGHWYLLTGLVLGIAAGLVFAWLISPVVYQDTTPDSLAEGYKEIFRRTIAEVYVATGDLERATSRLNLLEDEDIVFALGAQAQRAMSDGREKEARVLALLASAIQSGQSPVETKLPFILPSETHIEPAIPTQTLPPPTSDP